MATNVRLPAKFPLHFSRSYLSLIPVLLEDGMEPDSRICHVEKGLQVEARREKTLFEQERVEESKGKDKLVRIDQTRPSTGNEDVSRTTLISSRCARLICLIDLDPKNPLVLVEYQATTLPLVRLNRCDAEVEEEVIPPSAPVRVECTFPQFSRELALNIDQQSCQQPIVARVTL